jgi:hypothetical protein
MIYLRTGAVVEFVSGAYMATCIVTMIDQLLFTMLVVAFGINTVRNIVTTIDQLISPSTVPANGTDMVKYTAAMIDQLSSPPMVFANGINTD